jgi:hypothetical protein
VSNSHYFKSNRGVPQIRLEAFEIFISQQTNRIWKLTVVEPEFGISVLFQIGVQRPASKRALERVTLASNRPARTSCSIFRFHWSARNSSNHSEKRESSSAERRETTDPSSSTLMVTWYTLGHQIKRKDSQEWQPETTAIGNAARCCWGIGPLRGWSCASAR